jgi:hypothetical protein
LSLLSREVHIRENLLRTGSFSHLLWSIFHGSCMAQKNVGHRCHPCAKSDSSDEVRARGDCVARSQHRKSGSSQIGSCKRAQEQDEHASRKCSYPIERKLMGFLRLILAT